jgi:small subunit ribosomal protein S5
MTTATTEETKEQKPINNSNNSPNKRGPNNRRKGGGQKRNSGRRRRGREPEKKEFLEEVLQIDRVTRVVKGGRRLRFRTTVIIGDRKGRVGLGIGKATDVVTSIQKAVADAKKEVLEVPIEGGTIPHEIKIKFKAAKILLMPGREGSGIIAGGSVRKICDLAGIENIVAKILGTNNRIVNAQATFIALKSLRKPASSKIKESSEEEAKSESKQGQPSADNQKAKTKTSDSLKPEKS